MSFYPSRVYVPGLGTDVCANCSEGPIGHRCIRLIERGELSPMVEAIAIVKMIEATFGAELGEMPEGFLTDHEVRLEKLRSLSQETLTTCAVLGLSLYYGASGKMQ